ncbi:hypothetical protein SNEBB_011077 [Seison nebaliae]|nr:hypothetical protein SNEBB_011077 [Seison nebaliae]
MNDQNSYQIEDIDKLTELISNEPVDAILIEKEEPTAISQPTSPAKQTPKPLESRKRKGEEPTPITIVDVNSFSILPSTIDKDLHLKCNKSKCIYKVKEHVKILRRVKLRIDEKHEIRFSPGRTMTVMGSLIVNGTKNNRVKFTSDRPIERRKLSELNIRLFGGDSSNEGLFQMKRKHHWINVCSHNLLWTRYDSKVICRQLGYVNGTWSSYRMSNNDSWNMIIDRPKCNGNEMEIKNCPSFRIRRIGENVCHGQKLLSLLCDGVALKNYWGGIIFDDYSDVKEISTFNNFINISNSIFQYVVLENGGQLKRRSWSTITSYRFSPIMNWVEIRESFGHALNASNIQSTISINNSFFHNNRGSGLFIDSHFGDVQINNCRMTNNYGSGIIYHFNQTTWSGSDYLDFPLLQYFDFCRTASTRQFPSYLIFRPKTIGHWCERSVVTIDRYFVTLHFQSVRLRSQHEIQVEIFDGLNVYSDLLYKFNISDRAIPQSITSRTHQMLIRIFWENGSSSMEDEMTLFLTTSSHSNGASDITIENSIISQNYQNGINITNSHSLVRLSNVEIERNDGTGLLLNDGATDLHVIHSIIRMNEDSGINMTYSGGEKFINNSIIEQNGRNGIIMKSTSIHQSNKQPMTKLSNRYGRLIEIKQNLTLSNTKIINNRKNGLLLHPYCRHNSNLTINNTLFKGNDYSGLMIISCDSTNRQWLPFRIIPPHFDELNKRYVKEWHSVPLTNETKNLMINISWSTFDENERYGIIIPNIQLMVGRITNNSFQNTKYGASITIRTNSSNHFNDLVNWMNVSLNVAYNRFHNNSGRYVVELSTREWSISPQFIRFHYNEFKWNNVYAKSFSRSRPVALVVVGSSWVKVERNLFFHLSSLTSMEYGRNGGRYSRIAISSLSSNANRSSIIYAKNNWFGIRKGEFELDTSFNLNKCRHLVSSVREVIWDQFNRSNLPIIQYRPFLCHPCHIYQHDYPTVGDEKIIYTNPRNPTNPSVVGGIVGNHVLKLHEKIYCLYDDLFVRSNTKLVMNIGQTIYARNGVGIFISGEMRIDGFSSSSSSHSSSILTLTHLTRETEHYCLNDNQYNLNEEDDEKSIHQYDLCSHSHRSVGFHQNDFFFQTVRYKRNIDLFNIIIKNNTIINNNDNNSEMTTSMMKNDDMEILTEFFNSTPSIIDEFEPIIKEKINHQLIDSRMGRILILENRTENVERNEFIKFSLNQNDEIIGELNGMEGYICDESFDLSAAQVLCGEMGKSIDMIYWNEQMREKKKREKIEKKRNFVLSELICDDDAMSIIDCDYLTMNEFQCENENFVKLRCVERGWYGIRLEPAAFPKSKLFGLKIIGAGEWDQWGREDFTSSLTIDLLRQHEISDLTFINSISYDIHLMATIPHTVHRNLLKKINGSSIRISSSFIELDEVNLTSTSRMMSLHIDSEKSNRQLMELRELIMTEQSTIDSSSEENYLNYLHNYKDEENEEERLFHRDYLHKSSSQFSEIKDRLKCDKIVRLPLPKPWNRYGWSDIPSWLYDRYLEVNTKMYHKENLLQSFPSYGPWASEVLGWQSVNIHHRDPFQNRIPSIHSLNHISNKYHANYDGTLEAFQSNQFNKLSFDDIRRKNQRLWRLWREIDKQHLWNEWFNAIENKVIIDRDRLLWILSDGNETATLTNYANEMAEMERKKKSKWNIFNNRTTFPSVFEKNESIIIGTRDMRDILIVDLVDYSILDMETSDTDHLVKEYQKNLEFSYHLHGNENFDSSTSFTNFNTNYKRKKYFQSNRFAHDRQKDKWYPGYGTSEQILICETLCNISIPNLRRWNLTHNSTQFPINTTASQIEIIIITTNGTISKRPLLMVTAMEKLTTYIDRFDIDDGKLNEIIVKNSSIAFANNGIVINSYEHDYWNDYRRRRYDNQTIRIIGTLFYENSKKSKSSLSGGIKLISSNVNDWQWKQMIHIKQRLSRLNISIIESTFHQLNLAIHQSCPSDRLSNNLIHWTIYRNEFSKNEELFKSFSNHEISGIQLTFSPISIDTLNSSFIWRNASHIVLFERNQLQDLSNFPLTIDGYYCMINVSRNRWDNCQTENLLSILGTEKSIQIDGNVMSRNNIRNLINFNIDSNAFHTHISNGVVMFNEFIGNVPYHPMERSILYKIYNLNNLPECAISLFGIQNVTINYNSFMNDQLKKDVIAGVYANSLNSSIDIRFNWWNRISDIYLRFIDIGIYNHFSRIQYAPWLSSDNLITPFPNEIEHREKEDFSYKKMMTINGKEDEYEFIGGILTDDYRLTGKKIIYVEKDITILPTNTLIVDDGIELRFFPQIGILVLGDLYVGGKKNSPIKMTNAFNLINKNNEEILNNNLNWERKHSNVVLLDPENDYHLSSKKGYLHLFNETISEYLPLCDRRFSQENALAVCNEISERYGTRLSMTVRYHSIRRIHSEEWNRTTSWNETFYCNRNDKKLENCKKSENFDLIHCQLENRFIYIQCYQNDNNDEGNFENSNLFWGGIRFGLPFYEAFPTEQWISINNDQWKVREFEESEIWFLNIENAGNLHHSPSPCIQLTSRSIPLKFINIDNCLHYSVEAVTPFSPLIVTDVNVRNGRRKAFNIIGMVPGADAFYTARDPNDIFREHPKNIQLTPMQLAAQGVVFSGKGIDIIGKKGDHFLPDYPISSNVWGTVQMCDSIKEIYITTRLLLTYRYTNKERICAKVLRIRPTMNRNHLMVKFIQFKLWKDQYANDTIQLYHGNFLHDTKTHLAKLTNFTSEKWLFSRLFISRSNTLSIFLRSSPANADFGFVAEVVVYPVLISGITVLQSPHLLERIHVSGTNDGVMNYFGTPGRSLLSNRNGRTSGSAEMFINRLSCERSRNSVFNESSRYSLLNFHVQQSSSIIISNSHFNNNKVGKVIGIVGRDGTKIEIVNNYFSMNSNGTLIQIDGDEKLMIHSHIQSNIFIYNMVNHYQSLFKFNSAYVNFTRNYIERNIGRYIMDISNPDFSTIPLSYIHSNQLIHNEVYGIIFELKRDDRFQSLILFRDSNTEFQFNYLMNPSVEFSLILSTNESFLNYFRNNYSSVNAKHNYWGTSRTSQIGARIRDRSDDFQLGEIIFQPFISNDDLLKQSQCPPGWTFIRDDCYLYIPLYFSYDEAFVECKKLGGMVASEGIPRRIDSLLQFAVQQQFYGSTTYIWLFSPRSKLRIKSKNYSNKFQKNNSIKMIKMNESSRIHQISPIFQEHFHYFHNVHEEKLKEKKLRKGICRYASTSRVHEIDCSSTFRAPAICQRSTNSPIAIGVFLSKEKFRLIIIIMSIIFICIIFLLICWLMKSRKRKMDHFKRTETMRISVRSNFNSNIYQSIKKQQQQHQIVKQQQNLSISPSSCVHAIDTLMKRNRPNQLTESMVTNSTLISPHHKSRTNTKTFNDRYHPKSDSIERDNSADCLLKTKKNIENENQTFTSPKSKVYEEKNMIRSSTYEDLLDEQKKSEELSSINHSYHHLNKFKEKETSDISKISTINNNNNDKNNKISNKSIFDEQSQHSTYSTTQSATQEFAFSSQLNKDSLPPLESVDMQSHQISNMSSNSTFHSRPLPKINVRNKKK